MNARSFRYASDSVPRIHNALLSHPRFSTSPSFIISICNNNNTKPHVPPPYRTSTFVPPSHTPSSYTRYPKVTLISTSCPISPSSGDPVSSASAAGLLAKSSRSSCLLTGGLFVTSPPALAFGVACRGSPNCKGASSSSSSSSERLLLRDEGLNDCESSTASLVSRSS